MHLPAPLIVRPVAPPRWIIPGLCAILAFAAPDRAAAAGTRAGTLIDNVATATYQQGGAPVVVNSNIERVRVDELIDVVVGWSDPSDVLTPTPATGQVLKFLLTNSGNGQESFALTAVANLAGDQFDPAVTSLVIDDGDGVYEPGIDVVYSPGANDPVLSPDGSLAIFIVSTIPGGLANADRGGVRLVATSKTGTGGPGTSFAGQGEGGGDAVLSVSGGTAADQGFYVVTNAVVALAKSAVVSDIYGGTRALPGSTITYTLTATVSGSGSLNALTIADTVPNGTTYVPGSLRLGSIVQTDAADADAGSFASGAISVALGSVPAGSTRIVSFNTKIN